MAFWQNDALFFRIFFRRQRNKCPRSFVLYGSKRILYEYSHAYLYNTENFPKKISDYT